MICAHFSSQERRFSGISCCGRIVSQPVSRSSIDMECYLKEEPLSSGMDWISKPWKEISQLNPLQTI